MAKGNLQKFLDALFGQLGDPYVWGDEGPDGFDCSGLVYWGLRAAGMKVGRNTADGYYRAFTRVGRDTLKAGDLLFFNYGRLGRGRADHVAIYLGNGRMIAASSSGDRVMVQSVDWGHFIGGRRVGDLSGGARVPKQYISGTPPPKGPNPKRAGMGLRGVLKGFGLDPRQFAGIIDRAIREGWTDAEFEASIYESPAFIRSFPGIFREDGSLRMSPLEYRHMADQYRKIAGRFGVNLDKARIGWWIHGDVSPDEAAHKAEIFKTTVRSEETRKRFNEVLKAQGRDELDRKEWFRFQAEKSEGYLYDTYEAFVLRGQGFDVTTQEAIKAARNIGKPGEFVDLVQLMQQVRQVQAFIDPELVAAGISDADVAVLESGNDPKKQRPLLEQILRNRQALSGVGVRTAQLSPVGRLGLFPALEPSL